MHDSTVPAPGSDSNSLAMLDVWHQLHCLNAVRRALYPERWPEIWEKKEDGSINYDTVEMKHVGKFQFLPQNSLIALTSTNNYT